MQDKELWSGTYYGVHFGAGSGKVTQSVVINNNHSSFSNSNSTNYNITNSSIYNTTGSNNINGDFTGSQADLFLGYNIHSQQSKYVFGGQLEGTLFSDLTITTQGVTNIVTNVTSTATTTLSGDTTFANSTRSEAMKMSVNYHDSLTSIVSLLGRVGFLAKDNTLVYGLVGPAEGRFDDTFSSQWQTGLRAGMGVEHKLNKNWSILAEYRFTHFNIKRNSSTISPNLSAQVGNSNLDDYQSLTSFNTSFNYNAGQFGIVYRC